MNYSVNGVGALKEKFNWIHISNYKLQTIKHLNVKKTMKELFENLVGYIYIPGVDETF